MQPIHHLVPHWFRSSFRAPIRTSLSAIQTLQQTLRGVNAFVTLLFDESGSLEPVWKLSHSLVDGTAFRQAIATMRTTPEVAALLAERYVAPPHDLEALLLYPPESLGYQYASAMQRAGFQTVTAAIVLDSDSRYVEYRWQQTHDIWHLVTGFDVSEIGEIGLQAFYLAQFQLPLASLLIANALIATTLWQPESLSPLLAAIAQGWQMGKTARPLIAQKWEEAWEKPLSVWQAELHLIPLQA
jgi:ubiquinone biosynthesis protein COQ4